MKEIIFQFDIKCWYVVYDCFDYLLYIWMLGFIVDKFVYMVEISYIVWNFVVLCLWMNVEELFNFKCKVNVVLLVIEVVREGFWVFNRLIMVVILLCCYFFEILEFKRVVVDGVDFINECD